MVEAHLVQVRARGVTRQVPAEPVKAGIGTLHHGHRVPANDPANPRFHLRIAGVRRLFVDRDGIYIVRGERQLGPHALTLRLFKQAAHQVGSSLLPRMLEHGFERVQPVGSLRRI
jgi:hypothetical protein